MSDPQKPSQLHVHIKGNISNLTEVERNAFDAVAQEYFERFGVTEHGFTFDDQKIEFVANFPVREIDHEGPSMNYVSPVVETLRHVFVVDSTTMYGAKDKSGPVCHYYQIINVSRANPPPFQSA